jgi:hypothetical protein
MTPLVLAELKSPGNLAGRGGSASNLQKTQYVIGTKLNWTRHLLIEALGRAYLSAQFYSLFLNLPVTFFRFQEFHRQANTRLAGHPPSGRLGSPSGGILGRRVDLARLPSLLHFFSELVATRTSPTAPRSTPFLSSRCSETRPGSPAAGISIARDVSSVGSTSRTGMVPSAAPC